jgi:hypothetical protein
LLCDRKYRDIGWLVAFLAEEFDPHRTIFAGRDIGLFHIHQVYIGEPGITTEYEKVPYYIQPVYCEILYLKSIKLFLIKKGSLDLFVPEFIILERIA